MSCGFEFRQAHHGTQIFTASTWRVLLKTKSKENFWTKRINLWYNIFILNKKTGGIIMMVNTIKVWFNYSNSPKCAHFNDAHICRTR